MQVYFETDTGLKRTLIIPDDKAGDVHNLLTELTALVAAPPESGA